MLRSVLGIQPLAIAKIQEHIVEVCVRVVGLHLSPRLPWRLSLKIFLNNRPKMSFCYAYV